MKLTKFLLTPPLAVISVALCAALSSFGEARTWKGGGGDALASTPANWEEGVAPAAGDAVTFDETGRDYPCTWDIDVALASWTQTADYANVVTIATEYDSTKFDCLEISGNVVLNGGTWTHLANSGTTKKYRLCASVGGDMTIGEDAKINVDTLGYVQKITVNGKKSSYGGNHGGFGGGAGDALTAPEGCLYDSVTEPEDLGDGGHKSYCTKGGGGAVKLTVAGALTHWGAITANGAAANWYTSAGGSVYLVAESISGTGTIAANGGNASSWGGGGGGRIAVKLTGEGADFSDYDIVSLASAVYCGGGDKRGSCGTIYAETAADDPGEGWLIMKGDGKVQGSKFRYPNPFAYDVASLKFAKITLGGKVYLRIPSGCALDLRGTEFSRAEGETFLDDRLVPDADGTMILPDPFTLGCGLSFGNNEVSIQLDKLIVANGGGLIVNNKLTISGDLVIADGGTVTSEGPNPENKVELEIGGDLTIAANGRIDVDGKGWDKGKGPNTNPGSNDGGSHGGYGYSGQNKDNKASTVAPYGSIVNPVAAGCGGGRGNTGAPGGGVIIIRVAGAMSNDGFVTACGVISKYMDAAGGSVNVTAGSLSGAGVIQANGTFPMFDAAWANPGGGRVAVTLTDAGADYSNWTGKITAYGGRKSGNTVTGGAGTVYLRKGGEAIDEGTLIVDNGDDIAFTKWQETPIGGLVEGNAFGSVVIGRAATLRIMDDTTVTLKGSFSNGCTFVSSDSGTVRFVGSGDAAIYGDNTFATLIVEGAEKTVTFEAGKTQTVTKLLSLAGEEDARLEIGSTESGTQWTLDTTGANVSATEANFVDTASVAAFEVMNGESHGNCTDNITFRNVVSGEEITWTGAANTSWTEPGNWDRVRAPIAGDLVTVPAGCPRMPALGAAVQVAKLVVEDGASLACGVYDLTVTGAADLLGTVTAEPGQTITVRGDLAVAKALDFPQGTLKLAGKAAQAFACTGGARFGAIEVTAPAAAFSGALDCARLTIGDGTAACDASFAEGMTVTANELFVNGDTAEPNMVLRSAGEGTWRIVVCGATVTGATVSKSDASQGVMIFPVASADGGGNVNWAFVDTRLRFTGATDDDFSADGNWQGGVAPGASDDILISGEVTATVSSEASVRNVTVGAGATLRVNAAFAVGGSLVIEQGGTVEWNVPGTIAGNLSVLAGGTLTHAANGDTELYKLDLAVGGNGFVAAGGVIDVKGRGYAAWQGPGSVSDDGSAYGGRGDRVISVCYGSYLFPTNIGSGCSKSTASTHLSQTGGGAVKLVFGGTFDLNGVIDASGAHCTTEANTYYSGSGGSILIRTAKFTGTGSLAADAGDSRYDWDGGGGRIAVYLTGVGATKPDFAGTVTCYGGHGWQNDIYNGSAGTIYWETAADKPGCGNVEIAYPIRSDAGGTCGLNTSARTDFPSPADSNETAGVKVTVGDWSTLNLTQDAKIGDITLLKKGGLRLNGHKLHVNAFEHPFCDDPATQISYGDGGEIIWKIPGFMIIVR